MPKTNAPNMIRIEFAVPAPLLEQMRAIAKDEGYTEAELHRIIWESGSAAFAERSNKRKVNQKLRRDLCNGDQE